MRPIPEIAEIIKRREALGISQLRLAKLSGLSISNLNELETGKRKNPQHRTIQQLSKTLDLLERPKEPKSSKKNSPHKSEGR